MPHQNESIELLIPDLPKAQDLLPWLHRIDAVRHYTNFGPLVKELEYKLARGWPVSRPDIHDAAPVQVLTLNTGTAPLELAIAALGIVPGAEVLMPAFTFPATASAAMRNGLQVVFSDVAPDTWQLTPQMAYQIAVQRHLALIMPVATFGCPVDTAQWDAFAEQTGIPVLIDAAAAFGNQAVGLRSHISFSMHATKPFGIGEGGLLVSRDAEFIARVKCLSDFGFSKGQSVALGSNAKLSEYAAAVGLAQWDRYTDLQVQRCNMWSHFKERLTPLPGVTLQAGFGPRMLPANAVMRLPIPAEIVATALARAGIATRRWYCPSLQAHTAFSKCTTHAPLEGASLTVTRELAQYSLGLPWHNFLSEQDFERIEHALHGILNSHPSCARKSEPRG